MIVDQIIPFSSIQQINKKSFGKKIILFGAGIISEKTIRLINRSPVIAILDNATNLWGERQHEIEISSPEFLLSKDVKDIIIIICTTSFKEVSDQLSSMGFNPEQDYFISPVLNDLRIISELETIEKKMLFTSGSPKVDNPDYGGGIYELKVDQDKWFYQKVISGNSYGLIAYEENYISVDTELGIYEFDKSYNILRSKKLPEGMRAHGIDYSIKHKTFFVVGSYLDGVLMLDQDFNVINQLSISYKKERFGTPEHHCNDCLVLGDSLYISMFSMTGNWKKDVFDGAVLEFDILTNQLIGPVIQELWMPHNIKFIDGSLHILDSLRGQLKTNNLSVVGEFPAFTRGLDHDGVYYFIGQSRNRNYSKNIGISKNISIDAGVIIFDSTTKASRFLQLNPKISEIHSILLL